MYLQFKILEIFKYFLNIVLYPEQNSKGYFIFMLPDMDYSLDLGGYKTVMAFQT